MYKIRGGKREYSVVFTQPFLVNKVEFPEDNVLVVSIDLAVNNRDLEMTKKFVKNVDVYVDHHFSKVDFESWGIKHCLVDTTEQSCVRLAEKAHKFIDGYKNVMIVAHGDFDGIMSVASFILGKEPYVGAYSDADYYDRRKETVDVSDLGVEFYCAIKGGMKDDDVRFAILAKILNMNGFNIVADFDKMIQAYEVYSKLYEATKKAFGNGEYHVLANGLKIGIYDSSSQIDVTELCFMAYEVCDVVLVKQNGNVMVANNSGINLLKTFNLESGAPFRVTVRDKVDDVLDILSNIEVNKRE